MAIAIRFSSMSPENRLAQALIDRINDLPELQATRRLGTVQKRKIAVMERIPSRFVLRSPANLINTGGFDGAAIEQLETLRFEIVVSIVDLKRQEDVSEAKEVLIHELTGYQPYIGVLGSSQQALSPFMVDAIEPRREEGRGVTDLNVTVECVMMRCNGTPPTLVAR